MSGYSTREVAALLGLSPDRVRAFARAGLVQPRRGPRHQYRFSFQDIVMLRAAKALDEAHVPRRKLLRALRSLRDQLPAGRSLAGLRIAAEAERVVVRGGGAAWDPLSGQAILDFSVADLAGDAAPLVHAAARKAEQREERCADDWYALGVDLETVGSADEARAAYDRALAADPAHAGALINLGRLAHDARRLDEAEARYRAALAAEAGSATAWFNLGVLLEDRERREEAREAYVRALAIDGAFADAHFNLARLAERRGDTTAAVRHLSRYRRLLHGRH